MNSRTLATLILAAAAASAQAQSALPNQWLDVQMSAARQEVVMARRKAAPDAPKAPVVAAARVGVDTSLAPTQGAARPAAVAASRGAALPQ